MSQFNFTIPPWLSIAEREIGVSEKSGKDHEARIVEYHKTTLLKANEDEIPWCSSFVNWCMYKAKIYRTDSAAARSWLKWGVNLLIPAFGCVTVLSRGDNPASGHVGFYVGSTTSDTIRILGGNQDNKVSIKNFPKSRVLAYRWP